MFSNIPTFLWFLVIKTFWQKYCFHPQSPERWNDFPVQILTGAPNDSGRTCFLGRNWQVWLYKSRIPKHISVDRSGSLDLLIRRSTALRSSRLGPHCGHTVHSALILGCSKRHPVPVPRAPTAKDGSSFTVENHGDSWSRLCALLEPIQTQVAHNREKQWDIWEELKTRGSRWVKIKYITISTHSWYQQTPHHCQHPGGLRLTSKSG